MNDWSVRNGQRDLRLLVGASRLETGVRETGVRETGVRETGVLETAVLETGVPQRAVSQPAVLPQAAGGLHLIFGRSASRSVAVFRVDDVSGLRAADAAYRSLAFDVNARF